MKRPSPDPYPGWRWAGAVPPGREAVMIIDESNRDKVNPKPGDWVQQQTRTGVKYFRVAHPEEVTSREASPADPDSAARVSRV